jgi:hypothetical protein
MSIPTSFPFTFPGYLTYPSFSVHNPGRRVGFGNASPCIHLSEESKEWRRIVESGPPPSQALRETLDFAEQLSWSHLGAKQVRIVEDSPAVEIS